MAPMARLRRRSTWLFFAIAAITLQAVSLLVAPATLYGFGPARPCASEQGSACMLAVLQPTNPFLWFGVGLYFVGATLMGLALYLRHRMRS